MILPKRYSCILFGVTLFGISCAAVNERPGSGRLFGRRQATSASALIISKTQGDQTAAKSHAEETTEVVQTSHTESQSDRSDETPDAVNAVPIGGQKLTAAEDTPPLPIEKNEANSLLEEGTSKSESVSSIQADDTPTSIPLKEITLETAAAEETDTPFPINLATALQLADARPLVVAAAQASAWVAEAQLQRAQLLWLPQFTFGAVYYRHDGYGPDFNRGVNNPEYGGPTPGGPLNQNINWLYLNGSLFQSVNLTDAIFQPLAARQSLDAQRLDIQTAKNDVLRDTADAYFDVHQYRGQYAGSLDVVERGEKLLHRIEGLSKDLIPDVEVNRARRTLAMMLERAVLARERWRVSSANLTQVLRLDPTAVVVPLERDHLQVTLIDPARSLDELIAIGVTHRPEIASNKAQIRAAEVRVRQEKNRPLLPLVLITGFQGPGGMYNQFGVFATGSGGNLNQWSFRDDVSLQLMWQLEGFGLGNLARIKQQRGEQSEAIVHLFKNQDKVVAEVTAAQARVQSASVRSIQAERELREAITAYDGNYEGLAETTRFDDILHQVFRPQEVVKALEELQDSYDRYFAAVAEYNKAQFELYHAIGYPAREVASTGSLGEVMEVDGSRPFNLPAVFDGPPAATR